MLQTTNTEDSYDHNTIDRVDVPSHQARIYLSLTLRRKADAESYSGIHPYQHSISLDEDFSCTKSSKRRHPIVAAHWSYGSQLNVLGGVKTIVDQDTYLQNWILLYNQHVHNATSEREVLEYLKTHGATHQRDFRTRGFGIPKDTRRDTSDADEKGPKRLVSPWTVKRGVYLGLSEEGV